MLAWDMFPCIVFVSNPSRYSTPWTQAVDRQPSSKLLVVISALSLWNHISSGKQPGKAEMEDSYCKDKPLLQWVGWSKVDPFHLSPPEWMWAPARKITGKRHSSSFKKDIYFFLNFTEILFAFCSPSVSGSWSRGFPLHPQLEMGNQQENPCCQQMAQILPQLGTSQGREITVTSIDRFAYSKFVIEE